MYTTYTHYFKVTAQVMILWHKYDNSSCSIGLLVRLGYTKGRIKKEKKIKYKDVVIHTIPPTTIPTEIHQIRSMNFACLHFLHVGISTHKLWDCPFQTTYQQWISLWWLEHQPKNIYKGYASQN